MTEDSIFRCPFEVTGEANGTIELVELGTTRSERLQLIARALTAFRDNVVSPGIRFRLATELWTGCTSLIELKELLVPFQAEIVAVDVSQRLYPILPFQIRGMRHSAFDELRRKYPYKFSTALALSEAIQKRSGYLPGSVDEVAQWLTDEIRIGRKEGKNNPTLHIRGEILGLKEKTKVHLLTLSATECSLLSERADITDPTSDQNTFSIVKAPLYPEEFGRYSEHVEIVVSREADIAALNSKTRKGIRARSNRILRQHGVAIGSLELDKQNTGVWIPRYRSQRKLEKGRR